MKHEITMAGVCGKRMSYQKCVHQVYVELNNLDVKFKSIAGEGLQ